MKQTWKNLWCLLYKLFITSRLSTGHNFLAMGILQTFWKPDSLNLQRYGQWGTLQFFYINFRVGVCTIRMVSHKIRFRMTYIYIWIFLFPILVQEANVSRITVHIKIWRKQPPEKIIPLVSPSCVIIQIGKTFPNGRWIHSK